MIFTACYTVDSPYEGEAERLRRSLERFDLEHDIRGFESRGSWLANCKYIHEHVYQLLGEHGTSLVYLDADATVEKMPDLLFDIDKQGKAGGGRFGRRIEFAYHELRHRNGSRELLNGTMYIRSTNLMRIFFEELIQIDRARPDVFEQRIMQQFLESHPYGKEVVSNVSYKLPDGYCRIFDHRAQPTPVEDSVIVHHQASRRHKGWELRDAL